MNPATKPIDARRLFKASRLDLCVKYLFAKSLLEKTPVREIKSLYVRHILLRTGGMEPPAEIGLSSSKSSAEDYILAFEQLILNIRENGFRADGFVPLGTRGLINGAHRIAAGAALNIPIPVKDYATPGISWDYHWFEDNGFSTEDRMRILKTFADLNRDKTVIFLLWETAGDHWELIESLIAGHLVIAGKVDLDFENNFVAFHNLIQDVYQCHDPAPDHVINRKIQILKTRPLKVRVIVAANEQHPRQDAHSIAINVKSKARDLLQADLHQGLFLTLHSSSSVEEARHLSAVLLSANNLRHLHQRLWFQYRPRFINMIDAGKKACLEKHLALTDIAVAGGAVLEVMGIKPCGDLDLVASSHHRAEIGREAVKLAAGIDVYRQHYLRDSGNEISDDLLIGNDEYHFYFCGLKFVNPELVKLKKSISKRAKDAHDLRLIELHELLQKDRIANRELNLRLVYEMAARKIIDNGSTAPVEPAKPAPLTNPPPAEKPHSTDTGALRKLEQRLRKARKAGIKKLKSWL
jgi:hypothetical protein